MYLLALPTDFVCEGLYVLIPSLGRSVLLLLLMLLIQLTVTLANNAIMQCKQ
jgi:hypothetical protein